MTRCQKCNVTVDNQHHYCPLCDSPLQNEGKSLTEYPTYDYKKNRIKNFVVEKLFLFLTFATIVTTVTINVFTFSLKPSLWSLVVTASLLYGWVTVKNTFITKTHAGKKILFQFIALSIFLFSIDFFSGKFVKWSTNFVIPFLAIAATLITTIIAITKKSHWNDYMGYLLATFLISLFPIILYTVRLSNVLWPSVTTILYSLLTILGLVIFSDKMFKDEIHKRFHL